MSQYSASSVGINADTDAGEGWILFRWPHELYGYEVLQIDLDGHCSRRMPINSGEGPPDFVEVRREGIRLRFEPLLASKLKLDEDVEIVFQLSEAEISELRRVVEFFEGESPDTLD